MNSTKLSFAVIAVVAAWTLVPCTEGASLSLNPSAPSGNILTSQMTDLGPGTQQGDRDFSDNGGPMGQSFTAPSSGFVASISVLSRANGAGGWSDGSLPFDGNEAFGLLFGQINASGQLVNTHIESAAGLVASANPSGWLTFTLGIPVSVTAGTLYGFSLAQWDNGTGMYNSGGWFGFAHSDTDVYAGGYAFNLNSSLVNDGGNNDMVGSDAAAKRYGFIDLSLPAPGNVQGYAATNSFGYDFAFAVQVVPEPNLLALLGVGGIGLGLICARGRRRA